MPHKRSRASHEARTAGVQVFVSVQGEPLPSVHPEPAAVLFSLETLRSALLTLNITWLKVAARRLRQILADIEKVIEDAQPTRVLVTTVMGAYCLIVILTAFYSRLRALLRIDLKHEPQSIRRVSLGLRRTGRSSVKPNADNPPAAFLPPR